MIKLTNLVRRVANRKKLFGSLLGLFLFLPNVSFAIDLTGVAFGLIAKIMFGLSWIISIIFGVFVMIEGYILQIIMAMNIGIVNSPVVRIGFPVALSFANLAFVFGIIVIAIATILNMQSYGIKNLLWKLLVMAIAVNFGLIIAGGILSISDNITLFFVNSTLPGSPGTSATASLAEFASTFAAAFNPQKTALLDPNDITNQQEIKDLQTAFNSTGQVASMKFIKPIISIFLSIGVSMIMIIILGGLLVMLLFRYLILSLLLVGLPLAWAAWPFPNLKKHFNNWWDKFLKQAFFTPIVIFFLWLSVVVAKSLNSEAGLIVPNAIKGTSDGFWAAVSGFLGGLMSPVVDSFVSAFLVGGIMVAGIIAAEKFGATFAKNTLSAVKEGGKGVQKRVLARGRRRYEVAKEKVAAGAGRVGAGLMGGLQRRMPAVRNALPTLTGANNRIQMALNDDGTAKLMRMPHVENGYFLDPQGNRIGKAVWDEKNQDYTKNKGGDYVAADNSVISRERVDYAYVPYDTNGRALSRNLIDKNDKPIYGVKEGNKVVAAWVDKEGRPVQAPLIDRAASGMKDAQIAGRETAEALRRKILQEEKGLLSDVFGGFGEGVSKGFGGSSAHDKALKNIKDALKAMEGDHGGGHEEAATSAAPGGGGAEHS